MQKELESSRSRPPVLRRVGAGLVLVVAAALAVHVVIGVVMSIVWIVVGLAAVVAILWALKTIV